METPPTFTALVLLVCTAQALASGRADAQGRTFAPLPVTPDVPTAPEPSIAPTPVERRPDAGRTPGELCAQPERPPARALDPRFPGPGLGGADHSIVHYDEPGDGSLWVRGAHYKASFDAAGVTYYPLFGSGQPAHTPLHLSPDAVTRGGVALDASFGSPAARRADRVEIDRGSFVEAYAMQPGSVEQLFVFRTLPGSGELVVRLPIACALPAHEEREAIVFQGELGRVTYGRAIAIDGAGRRVDAPTALEDGGITIRVDAAFLEGATLPLTIDPVVTALPIDTTGFHDFLADVAYDASTQRWMCTYQEEIVVGDDDVYYQMLTASGGSLWGGYVNSTTEDWRAPRCANLASATQFLVVCETFNGGGGTIEGRRIEADLFSISPEFQISGGESGSKRYPSVGGDPFPFGDAFYCVAYERIVDAFGNWDILVRLVGPDGSLSAINFLSNSGGTLDGNPEVSKSNGGSTWTIVWTRLPGDSTLEIWGGRVRFDGVTLNGPFGITAGSWDQYPDVSTPLIGNLRTMVVYERDFGTDYDVCATVLDGPTAIRHANLSIMESTWLFADQSDPRVDSDGHHFLVAYGESNLADATNYDVFASDFYLSGTELGLAQSHVPLGTTGVREGVPCVGSAYGSGGPARRYLVAWQKATTASNYDVHGALFDGYEGGVAEPFCPGDGSVAACPCGNNGTAGRGCASSVNPSGGLLALTGNASTWTDTAVLTASGLPATALCIFLQGSAEAGATPLGDGLSCLGGTLLRMGSKTASGGVASYPGPGDGLLHNRGVVVPLDGEIRRYQTWYRNSAPFCTPSTNNLTNALRLRWAR